LGAPRDKIKSLFSIISREFSVKQKTFSESH
jgi:hypothetical protein